MIKIVQLIPVFPGVYSCDSSKDVESTSASYTEGIFTAALRRSEDACREPGDRRTAKSRKAGRIAEKKPQRCRPGFEVPEVSFVVGCLRCVDERKWKRVLPNSATPRLNLAD